jgi:hypothetical protein
VLLGDFLKSASEVLMPGTGEVHVALLDAQGGARVNDLGQWKGSWKASQLAAEAGLMLADVSPFDAADEYRRSSYRGRDAAFHVGARPPGSPMVAKKSKSGGNKKTNGGGPQMHTFIQPPLQSSSVVLSDANDAFSLLPLDEVPTDLQLCCRHELHIRIPGVDIGSNIGTEISEHQDVVVNESRIQQIIQDQVLPPGIVVEIPMSEIMEISRFVKKSSDESLKNDYATFDRIAVFLIVYRAARAPLTRTMADEYRAHTEDTLERFGYLLRQDRKGRMVSNPFPYRVRPTILDELKLVQESMPKH